MKTVDGKLSRGLQVRVLPGAPDCLAFSKIRKTVVGVAQLVEPRVVIPVVVGSSPIVHPIFSGDVYSVFLFGDRDRLSYVIPVGLTDLMTKQPGM